MSLWSLRQVDPIIANVGGYIRYVHRSVCSLHDLIHELQEDIKDLKAKTMKTERQTPFEGDGKAYPQGISDKSINPIVCAAMFNYGQWSQTPKVLAMWWSWTRDADVWCLIIALCSANEIWLSHSFWSVSQGWWKTGRSICLIFCLLFCSRRFNRWTMLRHQWELKYTGSRKSSTALAQYY